MGFMFSKLFWPAGSWHSAAHQQYLEAWVKRKYSPSGQGRLVLVLLFNSNLIIQKLSKVFSVLEDGIVLIMFNFGEGYYTIYGDNVA